MQNRSVQLLQRPLIFDKALCKPVQQFRMSRFFTKQSEVICRLHESASKMPAPHTIDKNSGRQRMTSIRQPVCEFPATAFVARKCRHLRPQHDWRKMTSDNVPEFGRIASNMDWDVGNFIFHHAHRGRQFGHCFLQRGQFFAQLCECGFGIVGILRFQRFGSR